ELGSGVTEPLLDHLREEHDDESQQEGQPEPVPEHGDAVTGMLVVASMAVGGLRSGAARTVMMRMFRHHSSLSRCPSRRHLPPNLGGSRPIPLPRYRPRKCRFRGMPFV